MFSRRLIRLNYLICFPNYSCNYSILSGGKRLPFKSLICLSLNKNGVSRSFQTKETSRFNKDTKSTMMYVSGLGILAMGLSYAAVPLYRLFCQNTGFGGTVNVSHDPNKVVNMKPVNDRLISVKFNADVGSSLRWNFKPQQREVIVRPGETALAFFTATNPTDKPVIGVSTYNVVPFEAGPYFIKIQCFCFDEQMLNPKEQVDMPVFFYIDPEFVEDPTLEHVDELILSYTFFESKPGLALPHPLERPAISAPLVQS